MLEDFMITAPEQTTTKSKGNDEKVKKDSQATLPTICDRQKIFT
jgi:hypothetical protein